LLETIWRVYWSVYTVSMYIAWKMCEVWRKYGENIVKVWRKWIKSVGEYSGRLSKSSQMFSMTPSSQFLLAVSLHACITIGEFRTKCDLSLLYTYIYFALYPVYFQEDFCTYTEPYIKA
jgi:hypothetical protein